MKQIHKSKSFDNKLTDEEIGRELKIAKRTVEDYRLKLLKKLKVRNTVGLVVYAIKAGLYKAK